MTMGDLKGKVAIVTGASKGIGAGIAKGLGEAGASVVVNYASSKTDAERVVKEIKQNGGKAIAVQGDVSNAGVYEFAPLESITEDEFHRHFNTNVLGIILATREAVKYFGENGGSVINIGSVVSTMTPPNSVVYTATKGAVDAVTRVLAKELGPKKVRVNSINPGGVETEGTHRLGIVGSDFAQQMIAQTPLGRFGQPDDIAPVAVFLASPASGWLTGEVLVASGGLR